ncbi:MAG TPA: hypothetical protein VH678_00350 [Xanthobacteraceae bacterium]|jgi:hypothetical protein
MSKSREPARAAPGNASAMTGRDGAADFATKASAPAISEQVQTERFSRVLGDAALALWGDLPKVVQEQLFERAVLLGHRSERDEMLREQLAKFLHDHHGRTTHEGS